MKDTKLTQKVSQLTKAKIQTLIQNINKINLENRKKPEMARAISTEALNEHIDASGFSREELIDKFETKLEENPNAQYLLTIIEMLKQYV